jgi:intracellular sulfur oxidation DsrE/DsrF family protein
MRKVLTLAAVGLLAIGATGCASLGFGEKQQKVVYHINYDDTKTLNAALGNIKNHINAVCQKGDTTPCSEKLDIKVVMHGAGLGLLAQANTDLDMQQKVISLKKQGVGFAVCNNTLVGKKINYKNDLFDVSEKDIVPSGVAELAILQQKGYVYIKP